MIRRAAVVVALITAATALVALAAPGTASADPAGPTDYESEIVEVRPDPAGISVAIAGGDSFVVLEVEPGLEVLVPGYRGEPYLRIDADGSVWENRRSPAAFENTERYGVGELPPEADHTAPPEWRRVGGGGSWAWHDHRAHRMEPFPPINVERGGQVLDAVIPIIVDGTEVSVRVTSRWMPAPSPWPAVLGALGGAALTALLRRRVAVAIAAVAAAALAVGLVQFRSLHPATDPSWLWWGAPALGLVAAVAAIVGARRALPDADDTTGSAVTAPPTWVVGATLVGAAQLVVWGFERRLGLVRAILPTDAPFWLDRAVTAAALSTGLLAVVIVVEQLIRSWARTPSPAPARR